jgi:hypothetical protein
VAGATVAAAHHIFSAFIFQAYISVCVSDLFDDFDDPVCPRIHQNGPIVHDGVAIFTGTVFLGNVVIGYAGFGQNSSDPQFLIVVIRRMVVLDDVASEARTLIDTQNATDAANHTTDNASDHSADRAGRALSFTSAVLNASRNSLGRRYDRHCHNGSEHGNQEITTDIHF